MAALSDRLSQLLADPQRAQAIGAKGRTWMLREWQWDLVARRFEKILAG